MVIPSHTDWERHKKEIFEVLKAKHGSKKANIFMRFYLDRYDKYKRAFLYYRICFQLVDDYFAVKNGDLLWYAAVGDGGTGKSIQSHEIIKE